LTDIQGLVGSVRLKNMNDTVKSFVVLSLLAMCGAFFVATTGSALHLSDETGFISGSCREAKDQNKSLRGPGGARENNGSLIPVKDSSRIKAGGMP
jgi:hypothetical protein